MSLLKELLAVLAQGPDTSKWNSKILGKPLPMMPRVDDMVASLHPPPPRSEKGGRPYQRAHGGHDSVRKEAENVSLSDLKLRILPFELEANTVKSLATRCKKEGTTIHGALCAAAILAARHHIIHQDPALREKREVKIHWGGPFSIRRLTEPVVDPETVGFFVSMNSGVAALSSEATFWEVARNVKGDLVSHIKSGEWRTAFNSVKEQGAVTLEAFEPFLGREAKEAALRKPDFSQTVHISNRGAFNFNVGEKSPLVRISSHIFSSNVVGYDLAWMLNVVSYNGRMDISISYAEPIMSHGTAKAFVGSFLTNLKEAISLT